MASELSRLIDDELEKVERESQANESKQQLRSSLRIKVRSTLLIESLNRNKSVFGSSMILL